MKYLKYFENLISNLWKNISLNELIDFKRDKNILSVEKGDEKRIENMLPNIKSINIYHDENKIYIQTRDNWYLISFYPDEYFIFTIDGNRMFSQYYLVDGWDGLENIINNLIK